MSVASKLCLIVNHTPDSFSGDRWYQQPELIIEKIVVAVQAGVAIVDIGAVSTRPGAELVGTEVELQRLQQIIPLVVALKRQYQFKLSLDSYNPEIVEYFLADIDIVNDVSSQLPTDILCRMATMDKIYIAMHSLTVPANPAVTLPDSCDPLSSIYTWATAKICQLVNCGIATANIIIDPGLGFNKTPAQNWYIIQHIAQLKQLPVKILVGHSRKGFLGHSSNNINQRDLATIAISKYLLVHGVDYIRVHNTALHIEQTNQQQPAPLQQPLG